MATDLRVNELLRRYSELVDSGTPVTAEQLCQDCPELLTDLKGMVESSHHAQRNEARHAERDDYTGQLRASQDQGFAYSVSTNREPAALGHQPAANGGLVPHPAAAADPPTMRYRTLRFHAKGGLGEVYVALDLELHRELALKRIQPLRANDPHSRQRFLLEAELTGRLEHPGIVPVHGLVYDADGSPCYAMRFVHGETLREAIRQFHQANRRDRDPGERRLAFRQLLGRFVAVCNTVAFAHSRGILHRDLKPSNILVDKYGETLVADWGLAKDVSAWPREPGAEPSGETSQSACSESLPATRTGEAVGTIGYMSPEQAAGDWQRVGPASDIYSLGATLLVIITGQSPPGGRPAGYEPDTVKEGGQVQPPRPKDVPTALAAICRKAMAPDPQHRYASALDLAADVEHWLADEPVGAWREPWTIRARRWLGRHRTLVTAGAAAAVMAVACLAVSTVLLASARERERQERDKAEASFQLARAAVDRYYTEVSQDILLNQPGMEDLRKRLLETARDFYQQLVQQRSADPAVRAEYGRTWWRLAFITAEIDSKPKAIEHYRQAVAIFEELVREHPEVRVYRYDLAKSFNNLGFAQSEIGQPAEAEAAYHKALAIFEKLETEVPTEADYAKGVAATYNNLGLLHRARQEDAKAEEAHGKALDIRRRLATQHPGVPEFQHDLAASLNNLGVLYRATRRRDLAEEAYVEALAVRQKLAEAHPSFAKYQHDLANILNNLGLLYATTDRSDEAEEKFRVGQIIWKQLVRDYPRVVEYHNGLASNCTNLASLYARTGRPEEAEARFQKAVTILEDLARAHPTRSQFAIRQGGSYCNLGTFLKDQDDPTAALEWYGKAIPILEAVLQTEPEQADAQRFLRNAYWGRGEAHTLLKRHPEAMADFDRAVELARGAGRDMMRLQRAGAMARMGQHAPAVAEANTLVEQPSPAPGVMYNAACVFALASEAAIKDAALAEDERARVAELYATRAIELLTRLRAAGFFKSKAMAEHLHQDIDLDGLRQRDDFKRLAAELKPKG